MTLPAATGGNSVALVYAATLPDPTWLEFDASSAKLLSARRFRSAAEYAIVTYTVRDSDVNTADADASGH